MGVFSFPVPKNHAVELRSMVAAKPAAKGFFLNWYFFFFFVSGFCGVLYELVWLRLAMAQFGVTTAMVSIVLSVFMAGMGLGAWASGRWLRRGSNAQSTSAGFPALRT
jgi:hypothetical protein